MEGQDVFNRQKSIADVLETLPDAIVLHSEGKVYFANSAALRLYRAESFEQLAARDFFSLVPPEDRQLAEMRTARVVAGKGVKMREARIITLDGRVVPVEVSSSCISFQGKDLAQTIIRDISERKNVENALRKSERRYKSLFANLIEGFAFCKMLFDSNGTPVDFVYLEINDAFERLTGLKRQAVVGRKVTEAIPGVKQANPEIFDVYGRVAKTGVPERIQVYFKPLSIWLNIAVSSPRKGYFVAVFENVTESKKAEAALHENQEGLELAQRVAHLGSWEVFVKEDRAVWSKEMFYIFEVEPNVAPNIAAYSKLIHPDDLDMVRTTMERLIATGKLGETVSFDYRILHPDGSICFLHSERLVRDVDKNGKVVRIVGIEQDITERKKAETALRESEEKFKLVAEVAKVLVYEHNLESGNIVIFRGEDVLGYGKGEISTTEDWWLQQIHPDDRMQTEQKLRQATMMHTDYSLEYRIKHKDGRYIIAHDTGKALPNEQGIVTRFVGGIRDITERKREAAELEKYSANMEKLAEERARQLQDAQRLAAIGATAGMVGHDIRNPLQAMISDVYLLRCELTTMPECETKEGVKESLDSLDNNITYVNKIVSDLQDYTRPLKPSMVQIKVTDKINNSLKNVRIPKTIRLHVNVPENLTIVSDADYLRRALTNLINNAVQAMPNGGDLTIRVNAQDGKVAFVIQDTGVGISEEAKPNLFKPLFTTKSKGQGLGLAVVKRLVEALGGTINFESEVGKGTKFILKLPVSS